MTGSPQFAREGDSDGARAGRERLREQSRSLREEFEFYRSLVAHPDTPLAAKALLGLAVGYALMPIDLIPDGIPVLGYVDDLILIPLLVLAGRRLVPEEVQEECRRDGGDQTG